MSPAAGVAYDGSMWVTAASSVGLVVGSVGLAMAGGVVIAKRAMNGTLGPPPESTQPPEAVRQRSMPLQKSAERAATDVPPPPQSIDTIGK